MKEKGEPPPPTARAIYRGRQIDAGTVGK